MYSERKIILSIPFLEAFFLMLTPLNKKDYFYVLGLKNEFIQNSVVNIFADVGLFIKNYETRFCYEDMKEQAEIHEFYKNLYEYLYRCINDLYGMPDVYTHSFQVTVKNINTKLAIILSPEA